MAEADVVSLSLLSKGTTHSKDAHQRFKFDLGEWMESSEDEKENEQPSKKRLKLDKSMSKECWQFVNEAVEADLGKKYVPKNTSKSTQCAHSNFTAWKTSRNNRFANEHDKQVLDTLLECTTNSVVLCKWLALFVAETRKQDGTQYPPKMLYALLAGLLC